MSKSDKKWAKAFIMYFVLLAVFGIGTMCGKAYVLKYQEIHKTDTGYCVEIDYKEYEYVS